MSKSSAPETLLFRDCVTVSEKLEALAEAFAAASEWRLEEDQRMRRLEKRVRALEEKSA